MGTGNKEAFWELEGVRDKTTVLIWKSGEAFLKREWAVQEEEIQDWMWYVDSLSN